MVVNSEDINNTPKEMEVTFLILMLKRLFNKGISTKPVPNPVKAVSMPLNTPAGLETLI